MAGGLAVRRQPRSFTEVLLRALAVSGAVYGVVLVAALLSSVLSTPTAGSPGGGTFPTPEWRPAYEHRFAGCTDIERWAPAEVPGAVVVVALDGRASRMRLEEVRARLRSESTADDVWTVGACR